MYYFNVIYLIFATSSSVYIWFDLHERYNNEQAFNSTGIIIIVLIGIYILILYYRLIRYKRSLSKILPEWYTFNKICRLFDINNEKLCITLLEANNKELAWDFVEKHFKCYTNEYDNILNKIQDLKQHNEIDKNDKLKIIRTIFKEHYFDFSEALIKKMEHENHLKYQDLINKLNDR